ncbi:MAG: Rieske 2Fe-2S domain-containing protein [Aigarchaeota archaeon]|nr:Rieske 2Fe-2S domain-containing protein [Candidatus Pelearchaeum maunauluense]
MAGQRRNFLKMIFGSAFLVTIAPFLSWGGFLFRKEKTGEELRQKVANISEVPPNSIVTFPFPRTGNPKVDSDPFRQYALIHLPNGDVKAFSKVCVHLWCLWGYFPDLREIQCPCHGSIYNPDTGVATAGPAALQPYPTNALPELKVEVDENGDIYVTHLDGKVGYGREWKRALDSIQKLAETAPDKEVVAYVPFVKPLQSKNIKSFLSRYNVRLSKAYGYSGQGKNREWLESDAVDEAQSIMDAAYGLDVVAKPRDLLKIADDNNVFIVYIRRG